MNYKHFIRLSIFISISQLLHLFSFAQSKSITLSGLIKDSVQQKPLAFVTVNLFKTNDLTQPITGTFTNNAGRFQLTIADTGHYVLILSHTGFTEKRQMIVCNGTENIALPELFLLPASANLKGVTVTARKPLIEQSDDKLIFNVESDPAAKTQTALDLLRKTPFVTVDGNDNIQVNGQSNFKVLLNGRETAMFAQNVSQALKGFPGAVIVKIEVITNPSAKYDAEGVGGIINIITQKKVTGYNSSLSSYYSTNRNYSGSANLSLKWGKVGVTGFYNLSGAAHQRGANFSETTPFVPSVFTKRTLQGSRLTDYFYNFGNLEISYDIDSLKTVNAYGNLSGGHSAYSYNQTITTDYSTAPASNSAFLQAARNVYPTSSIGSDYIQHFKDKKDKEFSIRFQGQFSRNNSYNNSEQDDPASSRYIINNNTSVNKEYTFQSDYILPYKNDQKLEMGVKAIIRRAEADFESLLKYQPSEEYKPNPYNTDVFRYHQEIYGAYGSYSFKIKKYSFRTGVRMEHTEINGNFLSAHTGVQQSYSDMIPNIQATRKWSNAYTMVLSYNMRLQRPYITSLNPFVNNNDSLNISYGNPNLRPQIIHIVALQNRILKGKTFAGITLSGSYSDNTILQYTTFNSATGVTATTSDNIGKDMQLALSVNANTGFSKNFTAWLNSSIRYDHIQNIFVPGEQREGFSGNVFTGFNYSVTKKFTISGSGGFFKSPFTLQNSGTFQGWYQVNFGYKFFKEKVSATVNFNNFFKKDMQYRYTLENPYFKTISTSTSPYRVVFFGITWHFGKLKENVSKKKGITNDDLLNSGSTGN